MIMFIKVIRNHNKDLSKHIDGQNSPWETDDKNTDNKQLISMRFKRLQNTFDYKMQQQMLKRSDHLKRTGDNHLTNIQLFCMDF